MHRDTRTFTSSVESGEDRIISIDDHFPIFVRGDAAHGVMRGRLNRHHLCDRVHAEIDAAEIDNIWQLLQDLFACDHVRRAIRIGASVHGGKFVDCFGAHIQINIVRALHTASFADLGVDGARDHVARGKVFYARRVLRHEAFPVAVDENSTLAAHTLRDEDAQLVDAGRVELEKFHIFKGQPAPQKHCRAIARICIGIGRHFEDAPMSASRHDDSFGMERMQFPRC